MYFQFMKQYVSLLTPDRIRNLVHDIRHPTIYTHPPDTWTPQPSNEDYWRYDVSQINNNQLLKSPLSVPSDQNAYVCYVDYGWKLPIVVYKKVAYKRSVYTYLVLRLREIYNRSSRSVFITDPLSRMQVTFF